MFFMMTVREEQGPQAADTCEDGWIWCYRKRFQKMPMRIEELYLKSSTLTNLPESVICGNISL